ncbi:protein of unknown function [Candidatus Promineifilum breve]|uniref:Uncharacterized protein n=1 Tax=Candidatus Promineifilum breve TaxID=1806508 RepID=A0A170PFN1_9CHLR|nr:protein of unknown function [Candidatus Promineifilum breve]
MDAAGRFLPARRGPGKVAAAAGLYLPGHRSGHGRWAGRSRAHPPAVQLGRPGRGGGGGDGLVLPEVREGRVAGSGWRVRRGAGYCQFTNIELQGSPAGRHTPQRPTRRVQTRR